MNMPKKNAKEHPILRMTRKMHLQKIFGFVATIEKQRRKLRSKICTDTDYGVKNVGTRMKTQQQLKFF